jgi:hypothetical protein
MITQISHKMKIKNMQVVAKPIKAIKLEDSSSKMILNGWDDAQKLVFIDDEDYFSEALLKPGYLGPVVTPSDQNLVFHEARRNSQSQAGIS